MHIEDQGPNSQIGFLFLFFPPSTTQNVREKHKNLLNLQKGVTFEGRVQVRQGLWELLQGVPVPGGGRRKKETGDLGRI